ncbi:hypothetical protein [Streptomyces corynorhini]|uniref:Hydrogenase expression protein HypF n=1 Tax=Streptomyces corynorhini TaxID=2282652 RepID=A0A370ATB5_9ACTN|nr:hypothetical protein [Streptomyces corynorhini]RDG32808.1 hypothetical protein DVH02_32075 [Streptomyces corynorhini]
MRGDDEQRVAAGGAGERVRRGPRHAAPRKSLLTKLQIPAGKAMALAAMPTAVFVGMGLTPRLAMADDKDIPFAPGPCVTRSDEPDASESPAPSDSPSPSPSPSASASDSANANADASGSPSPSPSSSASSGSTDAGTSTSTGRDTSAESGRSTAKGDEPAAVAPPEPSATSTPSVTPTPTPTPTKSSGLLDPLGLGDVLGGLLGGGKSETADPEPSPSATATGKPEPSATPSTTPSGGQASPKPDQGTDKDKDATDGGKTGGKTGGDKTGGGKTGKTDAAAAAKEAIEEAADRAGATVEELDEAARGLAAHVDDDIPAGAGGKEPFPCPTADPDALAAAQREPGIPLLPDDPWQLDSSLLTLTGLDYKGIVEVRTGSGKTKKALKFTAASLDIKDLHQTVVHPAGKTGHVKARTGSTSTIRGGEVTMYTEELKGNLFGLIPVTFSPQTPPPLNIPFAFFTDAQVIQAGQFGGTLTVPGLQNYVTD